MRTHEYTKLLNNALQHAQSVVLSESVEQVLDDALLVSAANVLLELLDNLLLIRYRQRRRVEDVVELGVLLEHTLEVRQRLGCGLEGVGLCRRGVLTHINVSQAFLFSQNFPIVSLRFASSQPLLNGQLDSWKSYQSARVGSVNAEEGNRGLDGRARWGGSGVASSGGVAGSNWGAGRTGPESGAEGSSCRHGG